MILPLPLAAQSLAFTFSPPAKWHDDLLEMGFLVRGQLGLALAKGCCFYDAHCTHCDDCDKRAHCHYGQSFKTPQNIQCHSTIKTGCVPHLWALQIDRLGLQWHARLNLVGMEIAHINSWRAAITSMPFKTTIQESEWFDMPFSYIWHGVTPARLKFKGKTPKDELEACKALTTSIVSKSKMLAAMHGLSMPTDFLPEPACLNASWEKAQRFHHSSQKQQSMSGWLLDIAWAQDTPESWKPWLNLALFLGVGKQTSFAMGRFMVDRK